MRIHFHNTLNYQAIPINLIGLRNGYSEYCYPDSKIILML